MYSRYIQRKQDSLVPFSFFFSFLSIRVVYGEERLMPCILDCLFCAPSLPACVVRGAQLSSCGVRLWGNSFWEEQTVPSLKGERPQRSAKANTCWDLIAFQSEVKRPCLAIYIGKGQKGLKILRQLIKPEPSYILVKENRCGHYWTMYRINLGVLPKMMDIGRQHVSSLHGSLQGFLCFFF